MAQSVSIRLLEIRVCGPGLRPLEAHFDKVVFKVEDSYGLLNQSSVYVEIAVAIAGIAVILPNWYPHGLSHSIDGYSENRRTIQLQGQPVEDAVKALKELTTKNKIYAWKAILPLRNTIRTLLSQCRAG